ncbi:hypothetical protein ACEWK1_22685 [Metabacillus sp. YM-086]|uniref:hypothetical protein n=1 Tax=Metabacillus sp. YM-086 TaxID=3341729 RepID=UPI003A868FEF
MNCNMAFIISSSQEGEKSAVKYCKENDIKIFDLVIDPLDDEVYRGAFSSFLQAASFGKVLKEHKVNEIIVDSKKNIKNKEYLQEFLVLTMFFMETKVYFLKENLDASMSEDNGNLVFRFNSRN